MCTVKDKQSEKIYRVYDITYDKDDEPYFLIYEDGVWVQYSASFYEPLE